MFDFGFPLLLVGVASAAIPLLIHLSRSRRTKKMRFSTTRFFTDQFLRSYRMSRLKELLLLALRMALCALLAIALAKPLFMPPGGGSILSGQSRSVALVIDNSASMAYAEGDETLLERAQAAARRIVDELRTGDSATVVLAARRGSGPEALFPEPTLGLGDVRQAIDSIEAQPLGTDLSGAVRKAEEVLRPSAAKSKEIYVLSDLQDSGWELEDEQAAGAASDNLYFFVSVRPKEPENLAVTAVRYAAARPMAGVPFSIEPHIRNHSDRLRTSTVRLYIDGKKVGERRLEDLQAQRWAVPRFHHAFTGGGWHSGYVEIDDTGITADDRRYFAFEVLNEVKVLAVNGAPSAVARLDELFFLKTALAASAEGESPIRLDIVDPVSLAQTDLTAYPLVILANVESVAGPVVEKLESFVDAGGSLMFFLGDKASPQFYNQSFAGSSRLHGGLSPGRLTAIAGDPAGAESFATIGPVADDHPALESSSGDLGNLGGVTFKAVWGIEPADSTVLMRTNGGAPLLCEKSFGKGRTLLFASTCDRDWTNFPVRPAFLPWTFRLLGYLAQTPMDRDGFHSTGDRVDLPVSAAQGLTQISIKKPDGAIGHAVATSDAEAPLAFDETTQPGVYSLIDSAKKDQPPALFVSNLENYESDLTYLDDVLADKAQGGQDQEAAVTEGLKDLLPGRTRLAYVNDPERISEASLAARRGLQLWDIVLMVVLAIALFEPWLANRISQRHYAKPKEIAAPIPVKAGRRRGGNRPEAVKEDEQLVPAPTP